MVREVLKIFTDNGLGAVDPAFLGLEITDYSFKPVRMGVSDFQAELKYGRCLDDDWTGREYVTFRGERHYIRHTPTSKKDNTDERWTHSLVFVSESAEILGNVLFYDAVYDHALTKDKPCSNSTKVTFFGDIKEFCDRLNCSLKYRGIGDSILDTKTNLTTLDEPVGDGFCVQVDPYGDYDKESTWEFSFEDKYIWEVITEGFNITEIPFEKRGKRIVFGAVPNVVTHKFEYGHENELLSITHRNANAKVINRITMLGSSENIPYYYPNETEYGHISVDTTGNAVLTSDKVTIANMTQFLSLLSPSNRAVLHRRSATGTGIPLSKVETAFNDGPYSAYNTGTVLEHHFETNRENFIPWNVRVTFTVAQRGPFSLSALDGRIWYQNTSGGYNDDGGSLLQGAKFEGLKKQGDISFTPQAVKSESGLDLGILDAGTYELTFSLRIPNAYEHLKGINSFCRIDTLVVSTADAGTDTSGFFWKIGDKEYKTGRLGIKVDGGLTDAMIGESIGWAASDRMPFQDHLIPPKFRQTLGAERFYEALNDTYTDPDTNKKYSFPNPFVEGAPSEHVHRDDKIKPTLKGMKNAANLYMGVIADIAFDMDDNDSLKPDTEDGDKNDSLKYEHSYFYIKLNVFNGTYGFNLFDHASQTDPMTIQMTDGSCNGCKFKIQAVEFEDETGLRSFKNPVQTTGENGTIKAGNYEDKVSGENFQPWQQDTSAHSIWICVQKDAETFGQILPSQRNGFVPKIGDTFNIINIDLPQSYILAAEKRLEEEGIRFMSDNNEEKFTFDINASRIFFAYNPDVLAELDEYSKLRVIYNGKEYEQYVSGLTINCKDGEPLPEIGISLTDTLAVGQGFVERVAERASSLIANPYTMGGYVGGAGGGISTALADKRYLNKQKADRSPHKIASDIGLEIGEFMSGSQGGIFHIDQKTGRSYIEVDEIRVRLKAIFESIQVAMLESIGGEMGITPGGSTLISYIEETETAYRCYFKGKDDDKGAECRFVVNDMVQCKESNIMDGTASAASNRYYWRLVTAVNNSMSYFELSKTDRDMTSDDKPRAGDTVMQLGNKTNNHRQSAIIMSTTNAFAPSIILYDGIDDYSLVNKAVVEYGVDTSKNPPEPFFHCYGSFYFGPRNKRTYLQFDAATGDMVFNGKFTTNCTVGDKVLADYIKEVSPPVEQEDIEDFVNNIVNPKLEGIQNQIDGVIETWFYNGVPTLTNYPASDWNTENLKIQHLGDLYYDNNTGTAYRFSKDTDGTYYWNTITDDAITKALAAAAKAQDTADGKRRVFTSQPVPPYDKGDLWVNATYPAGNTVKDAASGKYVNDILRCNTSRATGSFAIGDWGLASNYTDDTLAQEAKDEIAGYQYLKEAIVNGAAQFIGGLGLISHIRLGEWDKTDPANPVMSKVWAGMNGIYGSGRTIASWWGGDMVDRFDANGDKIDPAPANAATSLVRMDGTGYFVDGLFRIKKTGLEIGDTVNGYGISMGMDGRLTLGNGIEINIGGEAKGLGESIESVANLTNSLSNLFTPYNGNTPLSWEQVRNGSAYDNVKVNAGLWTESFLSARGINPNGGSGGGGVFYLHELLDTAISNPVSGQALVYNGTKWINQAIQTGLDEAALGAYLTTNNYAKKTDIPSLTGYATETWVQQQGYLTAHQTIRTLTIQKNGTAVGTFNPTGSVNATLNITDVASAATLSSHTGDTTVHITAAERTKWNKVVTDFAAITGTDSDTIINKWEEVVAFLDTYTEADTLAGLLGNKVDKVAGKGLSANDFTDALLTKLNGIEAGANKYIHPTGGANTTIAAANGKVLSAITVNSLGHVTAVSAKTLVEADIPALAISKITGLQTALDSKLNKSVFEELFEKVNIGTASAPVYAIKAKFGLYTEQFLSARGVNPNGGGSAGATSLSGLSDVILTNPASGQALVYNGTSWVNQAIQTGLDTTQLANYLTTNNYAKKSDIPTNYVTIDTAQTVTGSKAFTKAIELQDTSTDQAFTSLPQILFHIPGKNYARFVYAVNGQLHLLTGSASALTGIHTPFVASNFVKFGGTSSQVLMADGSVQPHYKAADLTTATANGGMITPLAMNQWVSANFYKKSEVDAKDKRLTTYYASRPASANVNFGNNAGLYTFLATSSMTTGKPANDAHILHMEWDNSLSWAAQIAVPTTGDMQWRCQSGTTWQAWRTLLDTSNFNSLIGSGLTAYVKKAGDTMTGALNINANNNGFNLNSTTANSWVYYRINGTNKASTGYYDGIAFVANEKTYARIGVNDSGIPQYWSSTNASTAQTIWHSGNDGSGSGLDADLLDGWHLCKGSSTGKPWGMVVGIGTDGVIEAGRYMDWHYDNTTGSDYSCRLQVQGNYSNVVNLPTGSGTLARTVDNVASATQLQTARTLWGQSFNGTGNVSGNMTGVGSIDFNAGSARIAVANSRLSAYTQSSQALGFNAGSLLVSNAWADDSKVPTNGAYIKGVTKIGTDTASYALNCASFICDSWVRTVGATGWYNESYGGGWYMSDSTWIRSYGSKSIYVNTGQIRCDGYFNREGYAGTSWNNGSGAYSVAITDNTSQTPLMVAYRAGAGAAATGTNRMFAIELLNTGEQLNICMRGQTVMQLYPNRSLFVPGGIWSDGYVSARGQNSSDIRLKSCITDFYATDIIRSLSPKAFKWNAEARRRFPIFNTDDVQYGLIAQETLAKNPWLVDPDMFHDGFMGVHYDKLIPVLLKGEIEIMDDVESLKRRVDNLERENRELKRKLERIAG